MPDWGSRRGPPAQPLRLRADRDLPAHGRSAKGGVRARDRRRGLRPQGHHLPPNKWRRLKTKKSHRTVHLWPQLERMLRHYVFGARSATRGTPVSVLSAREGAPVDCRAGVSMAWARRWAGSASWPNAC